MSVIYLDHYRPSTERQRMAEERYYNRLRETEYRIKQIKAAARELDRCMPNASIKELCEAMRKAKIVIENGGTVAAAVYRATGCEPFDNGPSAA